MDERDPFKKKKPEREPEVIEVDQYEGWKIIKPGNIGETTGLGPCFGVIMYDPKTKYALVGHFVVPSIDDFKGMLSEAKKRFKDIKQVKVYIGGAEPDLYYDESFELSEQEKERLRISLEENGFENVETKYQGPGEDTIMRIDTRTGIVEYDTQSHVDDE